MKKFLFIAAAIISLAASVSSCTKTEIQLASYKFDEQEIGKLEYMEGHISEAQDFLLELSGILAKYAGTEFTEMEIVGDIDNVVSKYNNRYIRGTFSLYKAPGTSTTYTPCKTWTMQWGEN